MHIDMHYAGTYAICRLAGINKQASKIIANCAQMVDECHEPFMFLPQDGSEMLLSEITTRHSSPRHFEKAEVHLKNPLDQLNVWVPFHFLPGIEGNCITEKLICRSNSPAANQMMKRYLNPDSSIPPELRLYIIGIGAHVYADTFAHYGFSGISSRHNFIENLDVDVDKIDLKDWAVSNFCATLARKATKVEDGVMGHACVEKLPDRPYRKFSFTYKFPGKKSVESDRGQVIHDNPTTYQEYVKNLHAYLTDAAESGCLKEYADPDSKRDYGAFKDTYKKIMLFEKDSAKLRLKNWLSEQTAKELQLAKEKKIPDFAAQRWTEEAQIADLESGKSRKLSSEEYPDLYNNNPAVKFYRAAALHQHIVLEEILPDLGLTLRFC